MAPSRTPFIALLSWLSVASGCGDDGGIAAADVGTDAERPPLESSLSGIVWNPAEATAGEVLDLGALLAVEAEVEARCDAAGRMPSSGIAVRVSRSTMLRRHSSLGNSQ